MAVTQTQVLTWIEMFTKKGDLIGINPNHVFADNTARDAYFTLHPTEKVIKAFISVGVGFQQWTGLAWIDKTAIIRGLPEQMA